jgi:hypothetical protein
MIQREIEKCALRAENVKTKRQHRHEQWHLKNPKTRKEPRRWWLMPDFHAMGSLADSKKPIFEFHSIICPEMNSPLLLIPWAMTLLLPIAADTIAIEGIRGPFD